MTIVPFKPSQNRQKHPPLINLPPLTLYLLAAIILVQGLFSVMPSAWVEAWGYNLAFVPARYTKPELFNVFAFTSPFTHLFVHGGWLHVLMNATMLAAFGAGAEKMFGATKTFIFFIVSGLAGALAQFLLGPHSPIPMVGCSGALSGLFAAVMIRMIEAGQAQAGRFGIWGIAAMWIGLSYASALVGGEVGIGNVAWAAHAGGFIAGMGLMKLRYFNRV